MAEARALKFFPKGDNIKSCQMDDKSPQKGHGFAHVTHFCMHNCGLCNNVLSIDASCLVIELSGLCDMVNFALNIIAQFMGNSRIYLLRWPLPPSLIFEILDFYWLRGPECRIA